MIITDAEARRIASLWQSPGRTGWTLAAIASGAWSANDLDHVEFEDEEIIETRRDMALDDVHRTRQEATSDYDHYELASLEEWINKR